MAYSFSRRAWLVAALLPATLCHAQVVTNITASPTGGLATVVDGSNNITGGTRSGANLFHSFGAFSVGAGDVANFQNDTGLATSNIVGRVTGGLRSDVYGTIRTTDFGSANLFLLNPAGWVFGPTATLEVGGSFHASTAHYLSFPEGRFYADPSTPGTVLSSAPPAAFGFLGPSSPIDVVGAFLQVAEGQTLSLVGGNVQLTADPDTAIPATLFAPSGRIQLGAFASPGEASIDGLSGSFPTLGNIVISGSSVVTTDIDGDPAFVNGGTVLMRGGDINISGFSFIDSSGTQTFDPVDFTMLQSTAGGPVVIRGGRLFIDSSFITSNTLGDVDGAAIDMSMSESITLTNASSVSTTASADFGVGLGRGGNVLVSGPQVSVDGSFVTTTTFGAGRAGDVSFNVGRLAITAGGGVGSSSSGTGRGGDVVIAAAQSISISGRDSSFSPSGIFTTTGGAGNPGDAGFLTLSAGSLIMFDGGTISSTTLADGLGGNVAVTVGQLNMTGGANIRSSASTTADGGSISVTVNGAALISGSDTFGNTGVFSDSCQLCAGAPGDIAIHARSLTVSQGGLIQSGTFFQPQGGNISVSATESILLSEGGGISTQALNRPVGVIAISSPTLTIDNGFIGASTVGQAAAGAISVSAGALTLTRGGQIASSSEVVASGRGGDVTINANSISISGTSPSGVSSTPFNTDPKSGIFSTARGAGNAGAIQVSANTLSMADGAKISVSTFGTGNAGTVVANIGNLSIARGARVESNTTGGGAGGAIAINGTVSTSGAGSGLFSTASSTGNAGAITVTGPVLTVANFGTIDSSTTGAGAGGAINVNASGQVHILDGGSIRSDSLGSGVTGDVTIAAGDRIMMDGGSISTRAATSDGGNIVLTAPNIIRLENSQITTSVESGTGAGGNILIDPQFVILNNSSITANAFGGPGGNVTIIANNFLTDPASVVSASSALSTPGTVEIESPDNNVAGSIAQLPRELVDASRLMRGACSARRAGAPSSFLVSGRGGVPADPDGYLPAFVTGGAPAGARAAGEPGFALAMAGWDCWR